jgi:uncharacterized protein YqeY
MLLNTIKADLKTAIKNRNEAEKNALRLVLGEIPRLNKKAGEEIKQEEIIKIINKLLKSEELTQSYSNIDDFPLKDALEKYLPQMMSENEIRGWIAMHVTLDEYNPRIKAMGYIMKELKGKADGNLVKKILLGK